MLILYHFVPTQTESSRLGVTRCADIYDAQLLLNCYFCCNFMASVAFLDSEWSVYKFGSGFT